MASSPPHCFNSATTSANTTVRRQSSIAYPSQVMCVGNDHLLRVGPFIIVRRYKYMGCVKDHHRMLTP
jgi:hypothetical protein